MNCYAARYPKYTNALQFNQAPRKTTEALFRGNDKRTPLIQPRHLHFLRPDRSLQPRPHPCQPAFPVSIPGVILWRALPHGIHERLGFVQLCNLLFQAVNFRIDDQDKRIPAGLSGLFCLLFRAGTGLAGGKG